MRDIGIDFDCWQRGQSSFSYLLFLWDIHAFIIGCKVSDKTMSIYWNPKQTKQNHKGWIEKVAYSSQMFQVNNANPFVLTWSYHSNFKFVPSLHAFLSPQLNIAFFLQNASKSPKSSIVLVINPYLDMQTTTPNKKHRDPSYSLEKQKYP